MIMTREEYIEKYEQIKGEIRKRNISIKARICLIK